MDYRGQAKRKKAATRRKPKPIRRPRVAGLQSTFKSPAAAAKAFYDNNEQFFDNVRDPIDGLRDWADGIDVRTGKKTTRRLVNTAAGRKILGARMGEPQIRAALQWVFAQAKGRRWDAVPWNEIDRLEQSLLPYYERPSRGGVPGITWRPTIGRVSADTLDAMRPEERDRVRDYESHIELKNALAELKETYRKTSQCIPPELRRTALHRIKAWSGWARDPSKIPPYACEPDPKTGGHLCNFPVVEGELRQLSRACEQAYDPDWAAPEAKAGAAGFPDTSQGEADVAPRPKPVMVKPRPSVKPKPKPKPKPKRVPKEKPRDIAVGVITGARVERLEAIGLTFKETPSPLGPDGTPLALRNFIAGQISGGKLNQLTARNIAVVPAKLTKRQQAAVDRNRKKLESIREDITTTAGKLRKVAAKGATTLREAEVILGGASEAVRQSSRLLSRATDDRRRLEDPPPRLSEAGRLARHYTLWEPIRRNFIEAEELAKNATKLQGEARMRVERFEREAKKPKPQPKKKPPPRVKAKPKPKPAPKPKAKPKAKPKRTKVEECASLLGKRGAAARKRKRQERLTEAEKRRALDDALAVAIS